MASATQVTVRADDENNASEFWSELDLAFPEIAKTLRKDQVTIDVETWEKIRSLPGFFVGPSHAPTALIEV